MAKCLFPILQGNKISKMAVTKKALLTCLCLGNHDIKRETNGYVNKVSTSRHWAATVYDTCTNNFLILLSKT